VSIDAAKELISILDSRINENDLGEPHFTDSAIETYPFEKENFKSISSVTSERRMAFVDGGNLEIFGAPNFSAQLNRIYGGLWQKNNRLVTELPRVEFFSAIFSAFEEGQLKYHSVLVPISKDFSDYLPDAKHLSFDSKERSLLFGQRADIQLMASIARNFGEWRYATIISGMLGEGDLLLMDGSLQTSYKNEGSYLKDLITATRERKVMLIGVSKTSTLHTTTGLSLLGAVSKLAARAKIQGAWYFPVYNNTDRNLVVLIAKFHPKSDRIFRVDIPRDEYETMNESELCELLGILAFNSVDASFPGYPYGLIDADLFSRVSENEKNYYQAIMYSHISGMKKEGKFVPDMRARDAHDLLNTIAGF